MTTYDYKSKDNYWQRRTIAEKLFTIAAEDTEELAIEFIDLRDKILQRHEEITYRCVYALRSNQDIDTVSYERGGFCDTWLRSDHYNLPSVDPSELSESETDDNDIPLPDKPLVIYLKPRKDIIEPIHEYVQCIHPRCMGVVNGVMHLFCPQHADSQVIKVIQEYVDDRKEITDRRVRSYVINHLCYLRERIRGSYLDAIVSARNSLQNTEQPINVIEVTCQAFPETEDQEDIIVYVDLIDCKQLGKGKWTKRAND